MRVSVLVLLLALSACTHVADRYYPSARNATLLGQSGDAAVSLAPFTASEGVETREVGCGVLLVTPADEMDFPQYIRAAFVEELAAADAYAIEAPIELHGQVQAVELNTWIIGGEWRLSIYLASSNGNTINADTVYKIKGIGVETICTIAARTLPYAVQDVVRAVFSSPKFPSLLQPRHHN